MTKTARTDAHRPSAMVPGEYRFLAMTYGYPDYDELTGREYIAIDIESTPEWEALGGHLDGITPGVCDHCGVNVKYVVVLLHVPTGEQISVGHQCYENRFSVERWKNVVADAAKRSETKALRDRNVKAVKATFTVPEAFDWAYKQTNSIAKDIAHKGRLYGSLSPKQIALLERMYAESQLEPEQTVVAPCPTGRVTITGEVLSLKWVENTFNPRAGGIPKVVVKDDRGFRVYGTAANALFEDEGGIGPLDKGTRVTFSAEVEPSKDDIEFGFFKKPTKAKRI